MIAQSLIIIISINKMSSSLKFYTSIVQFERYNTNVNEGKLNGYMKSNHLPKSKLTNMWTLLSVTVGGFVLPYGVCLQSLVPLLVMALQRWTP